MRAYMIVPSGLRTRVLLLTVLLTGGLASGLQAQTSAPAAGTVETALLLRQLDGEKRVLMVGAHPDDEDTALLAALARGHGARTAYLSLSRGEGGQNLIGPELDEGLGLIRTGELLAARSLDGASQYFSRAFDFGYSKNAQETFRHWPEEELVRDIVWVIRSFRPQIVTSIFSGTPRDGHGHHQAAGIATRRAFALAGDPSAFPDQLDLGVTPWAPQRLYQLDRRAGPSSEVVVETGRLDPLLGRSWFQLAMDSRSQHRSQDMGTSQTSGPQASGGVLEVDRAPEGAQAALASGGFFAGIDTTLSGVVREAGLSNEATLLGLVERYRAALAEASAALDPLDPGSTVPHLGRAVESLQEAGSILRSEAGEAAETAYLRRSLAERERLAARAMLAAAGAVVDVRVDRRRLVPGDRVGAEISIWNGGSTEITVESVALALPEGWPEASGDAGGRIVEPGGIERWSLTIEVPVSARPSQPYFLEEPRDGDLYTWPADPAVMAQPANPPLVSGEVALAVGDGPQLTARREASFVGVDKASGEFRVPVHLTPALSVDVEPSLLAWPADRREPGTVAVRVSNLSANAVEAEVVLPAPSGWDVSPASRTVALPPEGGAVTVTFEVAPTAPGTGKIELLAVARANGRTFDERFTLIDYPHIDPLPFVRPARLSISRFDVQVSPNLTVGYVMGSGDAGLDALVDLGVTVEPLGPEAFPSADLTRFDAIVLGIRAYETRPDLVANNERLLEFAREGGTVVAQYNKYEYPAGGFAPFPVEMSRPHDRVTDPSAEVSFLDPDHPAVSSPNRLSSADFEGWVQERGLYFLSEWDERYQPLLAMSDPGEPPARGSLVVAPVGAGAYVYTGLALFRQLPEGVPGAYRLLANLVSLHGSDL